MEQTFIVIKAILISIYLWRIYYQIKKDKELSPSLAEVKIKSEKGDFLTRTILLLVVSEFILRVTQLNIDNITTLVLVFLIFLKTIEPMYMYSEGLLRGDLHLKWKDIKDYELHNTQFTLHLKDGKILKYKVKFSSEKVREISTIIDQFK